MGSYGKLTGIREMHAITFTVTLQSCARARAPDAMQHSALASIVGVRSGPFILFTIAKSYSADRERGAVSIEVGLLWQAHRYYENACYPARDFYCISTREPILFLLEI